MLIDGKEVLYTIQNGKIVDPNIPTDGLVCYLDTRGKNNTDKHKGTLLDLSGNGNHGTLENFNFTESSGYVKDISSGYAGLNFDGIDDDLLISTSYIAGDPFTQFIDFEIKNTAKTQGQFIFLGSTYIHFYDDSMCLMGSESAYIDIEISPGRYQLCFSSDGNHLRSNAWINGVKCAIHDASDYTFTHTHSLNGGKKTIHKYAFWDRQLTEQEIQKLWGV